MGLLYVASRREVKGERFSTTRPTHRQSGINYFNALLYSPLMRRFVTDRWGHEIYLTDERWQHICEEHPEMFGQEKNLFETVRRGRRFQDSIRPEVYLYSLDFRNLPCDNTAIVVVVRFGFHHDGSENNFILTAYQIYRR